MSELDDLTALAAAHGVSASYEDGLHRERAVPRDSLRAVLAAMEVPAADDDEVRASLAAAREALWRTPVPATVVSRAGTFTSFPVALPDGVRAEFDVEVGEEIAGPADAGDGPELPPRWTGVDGGARLVLADGTADGPAQEVDGRRVRIVQVPAPAGLPLGAHRLRLRAGDTEATAHLLVVPAACPGPAGPPAWGWQVQLYALRSAASWGIGDLGDLRTLVGAAGRDHGADFVLLNPLHAVLPVVPQENSPYSPASRRFANPLYLRVEDCDGHAALDAADRARVDALAAEARALLAADRIDRDRVFRCKAEAFALLAAQPLPPARAEAFAAYRAAEGQGLQDAATAAALAERHGRSFQSWPAPLRDPRSPAVAAARAELADRVALHTWLQWQCDVQLGAAARAAAEAGMRTGLMADLAVGVDPGGSDAWALQADLALGVTVGAPPDPLAPQGQDWALPPLRPDRLPLTGYAPFRDLVRTTLRHAGALRIDHILGLFRLFWIPRGASAADGAYVRYPTEELLGVLALEATAAGAVVVGEDLGTVGPGVRETLADHGVLGTRVVWFERDPVTEQRVPAAGYPELALTTVTTHDLPTAAGWFADEPTRIRAALGLLAPGDVAAEAARTAADRAELVALLAAEGLVDPGEADLDALVRAVHAFVARTPSRLVSAALADGVGDLRQPNLPGTVDEYPNWRLPVAEPTAPASPATPGAAGPDPGDDLLPPSRPLLLEEVLAAPGVTALAAALRDGRAAADGRPPG